MPLVNLYRQAKAPLETYCQHGSGPLSPNREGGEPPVTAVAVELLPAPPASGTLDPDAAVAVR